MDERKYVPYFLFFMVGYIVYNVASTLEYLCKGQVIIELINNKLEGILNDVIVV
jgi:fucose 4-O-acetylase-like acetyltransferase